MSNYLRYLGLGLYGGITALVIALDKIVLDTATLGVLLAPIVVVVTADIYKHRDDPTPSS